MGLKQYVVCPQSVGYTCKKKTVEKLAVCILGLIDESMNMIDIASLIHEHCLESSCGLQGSESLFT